MYIDGNGDAEGNYSVVAVRDEYSDTGTSRMVMQPVGFFHYPGNAALELPVREIKLWTINNFLFLSKLIFSLVDFQIFQRKQTVSVGWWEETEC